MKSYGCMYYMEFRPTSDHWGLQRAKNTDTVIQILYTIVEQEGIKWGFINLECRFQPTNGAFGCSYVHNFDQNNNGTIHK